MYCRNCREAREIVIQVYIDLASASNHKHVDSFKVVNMLVHKDKRSIPTPYDDQLVNTHLYNKVT